LSGLYVKCVWWLSTGWKYGNKTAKGKIKGRYRDGLNKWELGARKDPINGFMETPRRSENMKRCV